MPISIQTAVLGGAVALALFGTSATAIAQQTGGAGYTRIQGATPSADAPTTDKFADKLQDLREDMRVFVQGVATYAHSQRRGFLVLARDSMELVIKRDVQDEKKISPAKTFMRSIDGVMENGVFFGKTAVNLATSKEIQPFLLERLAMTKNYGLPIMIMDYATTPATIDSAYRDASKHGFVAMVSHRPDDQLTELPPYPKRPYNENPNNILTLRDAKNFTYISDPSAFGRQDEFALQVHGNNFDMIIVDPFHGREPLSAKAVETLKYKKLGARRLVLARIDIGTASSYRYYWGPDWKEGSPAFIAAPYPTDPDRYFVEYWRPSWKQIIFGNDKSYLYGIIRQGYDGVVLDGLRTFRFFEAGEESLKEFAPLAMTPPS